MTPEKRAREVRNKLRDECLRLDNPGLVGGCGCSWCHAIESLLPPGCLILTPDEARVVREALCPAYDLTEALDLLGGVS